MPGLTLDIKFDSPLHRRLVSAIRDRVLFSKRELTKRYDKWRKAEEAALAYIPERDVDALRRSEREGGKPQYTTVTLPYTYGILMTSHTYWTTVFLARDPILQYSARHGEPAQQVQAVEALIDYQIKVGKMTVPLYIWLMDVGKYGVGILGNFWDEQTSTIAEIVEEEETLFGGRISTGRKKKVKRTRRVPGYHGNRVYNVRPFDFFPDPRIPLSRFQEGEFCAVFVEMGWNTVLQRKTAGLYTNIERLEALRRGGIGAREEGSSQLELPQTDTAFDNLEGGDILFKRKTSDIIKAYEVYIDLIPSVWGLGQGDVPEKWVFTVTSDFSILIGAQPLGAIHDTFPFQLMEFEPEGYALVNRGIPEILEPVQRTLDWLLNTHFYNVRKTLNNQFVGDPSRIVMRDVLDPLPGGFIRVKPAGYGQDISKMLQQLPVVDITRGHMADLQAVIQFGQRSIGVNDQVQGIVEPRGRRTAQETRTTTGFSINRLKTNAEFFSAQGWAPMAQMFLQNSQQYYDLERQFRIVGDLASGPKFAQVTPESIAGFYDFVAVDGTLPVDRFAQANLWRGLLGEMRQFPEILANYDVGRIFAWVAQLAGLKNINQFRIDLDNPETLQRQAQAGNVVPIPSGTRDVTRVPEPGQLEGQGTSG